MSRWKSATVGWWLLAVYVLAWDWGVAHKKGGETLTAGFGRGRRSRARHAVVGLWVVTTLHLFGLLPRPLDPYSWLGRAYGVVE